MPTYGTGSSDTNSIRTTQFLSPLQRRPLSQIVGPGAVPDWLTLVASYAPLAFYRQGEAAGTTTLVDSSGNARDGTYSSSAMPGATGIVPATAPDTAAAYGAANSASVTSAAWMNVTNLTVFAWVTLTPGLTGTYAVWDRDLGAARMFQFRVSNRKVELINIGGGVGTATGATSIDGNPHFIAGTFDGATLKVYVDGVLDGSTAFATALPSVTARLALGVNDASSGRWPNTIDEAAYLGTALTAGDIATLYASGLQPAPVGAAVTGTAAGSLTSTGSTSGIVGTLAAAAAALALAATATGVVGTNVGASGSETATGAATGKVGTSASAAGSLTVTGSASGVVGTLAAAGSYSAEVLADTPSVYWRLGELSGSAAADTSGNARVGTYTGGFTLGVAGPLVGDADTAVTFNGTTGVVNITPYAAWMDPASFTCEAWVKTSSAATQTVIARDSATSGTTLRSWQFRITNGDLEFVRIRPSVVTITATATLDDNAWHHVACTYDGTDLRLYIDGALVQTTAMTTPTGSTATYSVGGRNIGGSAFFAGSMDEAAYYGTALSDARILARYTAGVVGGARVTLTGLATGRADHAASAAGSLTATGSTAGQVGTNASAAGSLTTSATAAGTLGTTATATATLTVTGAASGTVAAAGVSASATGALTLTGAAGGLVATSTGASATATATGAATGVVGTLASASGSTTATGSAAGNVAHASSAAGALTLTGTATGSVGGAAPAASAAGTLTTTGAAAGAVGVRAGATATVTATGAATGGFGVSAGAGATATATGSTAGTVGAQAGATASLAASGSAVGVVGVATSATGALSATGSASGAVSAASDGTAAGVLTATGSATGAVSAVQSGRILSATLAIPTATADLSTATATGALAVPTATAALTLPTVSAEADLLTAEGVLV